MFRDLAGNGGEFCVEVFDNSFIFNVGGTVAVNNGGLWVSIPDMDLGVRTYAYTISQTLSYVTFLR